MSLPVSLTGKIFRYGGSNTQFAFQSGQHGRHVILLGGLLDGPLNLPYIPKLSTALEDNGWSLVLPYLSSSNQGYGTGSLDRDADEVKLLLMHLKEQDGCEKAVIVGHSTGCQDAVRFVKRHGSSPDIPLVAGIILQGPVSDQELEETYPETPERLQRAKEMMTSGKGEEILLREFQYGEGEPITARRYMALAERRGDDDMFSSYLTDEEMKALFSHMSTVKTAMVVSGGDEYIPDHVDKERLTKRLATAMGNATYEIVDGAKHTLLGHEDRFVALTVEFLETL